MLKKSILVALCLTAAVISVVAIVRATNDNFSPWQNTGAPIIQKSADLTPNTYPQMNNLDCTPSTVRRYLSTGMQDECLVMSAVGQASSSGVIFNGSSEMIQIVPPRPFDYLQPVPNQSMFYTTTSAPVVGLYMHFYRSIYDKLPALPQSVGGVWQMKLTANPDFTLRDKNGVALPVNISSMAFSKNGSWMIVDIPWKGFVRINMATFDIVSFAPSLQPANDYSNVTAQLAISNDGNSVAIRPNNEIALRMYNLKDCNNTSLPVAAGTVPCPMRDYSNTFASQITGYRALYKPRFMNNTQLTFDATYNHVGSSFKSASYTMTAPGVSPTGIDYLGMGDSFASGEGAHSYVAGTDTDDNKCHTSSKSYGYILGAQIFSSGYAVSCSGAQTQDINGNESQYKGQTIAKIELEKRDRGFVQQTRANYLPGYLVQSEFIDVHKPEAVTLSIGGNNVGFSNILAACVSPVARPKACYPDYEDRLELNQKINGIFNELVATYQAVLQPGKRVYIVGYPQIVVDGNCAANVHFERSEIEMATDLINYLNQTISRAADKAGVRYVDVSNAFAGHRMCEAAPDQTAVNGLTAGTDQGAGPLRFIGRESYHPNALGHELLARAIRGKTNNLTQPMPGGNATLQAPGLPVSLDGRNLPKTGRAIRTLLFDDNMSPDTLMRGQTINVATDTVLKPNTVYKLLLSGSQLGSATANAQGVLSISGTLSASAETGFQTIHITGVNQLGQPIDVTKTVYVAASSDDYDGDGLPDLSDSCRFVGNIGRDIDMDGTDDACDPVIGLPPPVKLSGLKASVTLAQNSITLTKQQ